MKLLIIDSVLIFLIIFINTTNCQYFESEKCSKKLQEIIHKPESCAMKYLERISAELKARSQVFFTPEADSFIYTFENTYNVHLSLADALGQTVNYYPNQTKSPGSPVIYADVAQSYINFPGFVRQVSNQKFYYTFRVFSKEGQYYDVSLSMPISSDPIFC